MEYLKEDLYSDQPCNQSEYLWNCLRAATVSISMFPLMFILLINLVLFIISTCFSLLLITISQGDRMGRQYFLHFIDEALLGTEYFDEKTSTRVQFNSILTCCLVFNTN